jgi:uncharacterized membrane protein
MAKGVLPMSQTSTVRDNIRAIIAVEEKQDRERSMTDRIADGIATFAGTVLFVAVHLVWFGLWAAVNMGVVRLGPQFDPYPFQLLCMLVSLEGVLLSTFVLIKQNRMGLRADRRAHLDLQVNLLTEKEVTKVIQLLERITIHLGIEDELDQETRELSAETAVNDLAHELEQALPEET